MKTHVFILNFTLFVCCFFSFKITNAQLGFCNGNSGDPIFNETFGTGITSSTLPVGTTTYSYSNGFPDDGFYTVKNGTSGNSFGWHQIPDHTPNDTNGKALIVNASTSAGEFYRTAVSGLCENTTYQFSAWLINLVITGGYCATQPSGTIPINVRFEIWDTTDTNLLASGNTGNITETSTPNWEEYGLVFQTLPSQTSVILKMINNGIGGCGNDLAIDDIEFKSCGDFISISDTFNNNPISLCSNQTPYSTMLTVSPDNSVFSSHFYQWEQSSNGITWIDINGETSETINLTDITVSSYYRAKVAESEINLSNTSCNIVSDIFEIIVNQPPTAPYIACWETATINNTTCTWDVTGTQPIQPTIACWETTTFNTTSCSWDVTGVQPTQPTELACWEVATFNNISCIWEISGLQPIDSNIETLSICENEDISIQGISNITNPTYLWNTGETTEFITINEAGIYIVEITDGCSTTNSTFNIEQLESPLIQNIESYGDSIIVTTSNIGPFEYSIDGFSFQTSTIFENIEGGLYTIYLKNRDCDTVITHDYIHFYIPKYFTPNGDTLNDTFDVLGLEFYESVECFIFDRYGKILDYKKNESLQWDGTFNGLALPPNDYWYVIIINDKKYSGHITLKR